MANLLSALTAWKTAGALTPPGLTSIYLIGGGVIYDCKVTDDGTTGDSIVVADKAGRQITISKAAIAYIPTTA